MNQLQGEGLPALGIAPVRSSGGRLEFIDHIRWALIVLVIVHHSAVTYSHVGSWYYNEAPKPELGTRILFAAFLSFNQAYFMGFLFLVAAYFAAPAFDRKGFSKFVRDRALRLGVPSLFFMLVVQPVIVYWILRDFYEPSRPTLVEAYPEFIASGRVLSASGPMWFAVALLVFSLVYALFRFFAAGQGKRASGQQVGAALPTHGQVSACAILIAILTFAVRLFQPVGTSVLNMQLANFAQYIVLFGLGILAYRRNWLLRVPFVFGIRWLGWTLVLGVPLWFGMVAVSGALEGDPSRLWGGWHWESALNCLWESFFCMGMSLGVLVLFRDRFHLTGKLSTFMTRNAFAAYLFHTPLLIAVTLALHPLIAPPPVKFVLASLFAVPITFLASEYVFRRIPGLREIL